MLLIRDSVLMTANLRNEGRFHTRRRRQAVSFLTRHLGDCRQDEKHKAKHIHTHTHTHTFVLEPCIFWWRGTSRFPLGSRCRRTWGNVSPASPPPPPPRGRVVNGLTVLLNMSKACKALAPSTPVGARDCRSTTGRFIPIHHYTTTPLHLYLTSSHESLRNAVLYCSIQ